MPPFKIGLQQCPDVIYNIYLMCIIGNVIVIDQFTFHSLEHLYVLTHWHADHYQGITQSWNFGTIYASPITRNLLLTKYPKLSEQVCELALNKWHTIASSEGIELFAFDSNHMSGSIMVLIKLKGKYYLHTGDMRFHTKIAKNCAQLFDHIQGDDYRFKYQVEQLHLDNTFCDPIFKFPKRSEALQLLTGLIAQKSPKRVFLCTDSVGKQEAFILLSRHYKTKIAVSTSRMQYIRQMNINHERYFTLDPQESWIQVIRKNEKQDKIVAKTGSIAITLTGWANIDTTYPDGFNSFLIPYSLHSNFRQMEELVSFVRPKKIIPIVKDGSKWQKFSQKSGSYKTYMFSLFGIKQRGLQFLTKQYCSSSEQKQDL